MFCEIARKLDDEQLARIAALEEELGLTIVAFACREMDAEREEKMRAIMEQFGPCSRRSRPRPTTRSWRASASSKTNSASRSSPCCY